MSLKSFFNSLFAQKPSRPKLPDGWTETKVSENEYILHIPEEQKQKWDEERRTKDHIGDMINEDGFYIRSTGRDGMVYYVEDQKVCEFFYEISGVPEYDLLFAFESLNSWFLPKSQITEDMKEKIKVKFIDWLEDKKIRGKLY